MNAQPYNNDLLLNVARRTQLREGPQGVSDFIRVVLQNEPVKTQTVSQLMRVPLPVIAAIRTELEKEGFLIRKAGIALTDAGRKFAQSEFGDVKKVTSLCQSCAGSGLAPIDNKLVELMTTLLKLSPKVQVELDQAPCSAETALKRAALMYYRGAISNRRILILGDDDSVSIAIPLYLRFMQIEAGSKTQITVLDIDQARVDFLKQLSSEFDIDMAFEHHDLRNPLSQDLINQFDVFQTDPPYTIEGLKLFLMRAREALKPNRNKGFLSFAHRPPVDQFEILKLFQELGFSVSSIHQNFNEYAGASILGNRGQLFELESIRKKTDLKPSHYSGHLYTFEKSNRKRIYFCASCKKRYILGHGDTPAKIEDLKDKGCSHCGNTIFRRESKRRPNPKRK